MSQQQLSDEKLQQLLNAVSQKNDSALSELYDLTVNKVYALAVKIVSIVADADEVVCDVFTQIWNKAQDYNPNKGKPLAWILMITRSRALDILRKNNRRYELIEDAKTYLVEIEDPNATSTGLLTSTEDKMKVSKLLDKLSLIQKQILSLAFLRGLTHQEIALATELPIGTVKSHIRRALINLRQVTDYWEHSHE